MRAKPFPYVLSGLLAVAVAIGCKKPVPVAAKPLSFPSSTLVGSWMIGSGPATASFDSNGNYTMRGEQKGVVSDITGTYTLNGVILTITRNAVKLSTKDPKLQKLLPEIQKAAVAKGGEVTNPLIWHNANQFKLVSAPGASRGQYIGVTFSRKGTREAALMGGDSAKTKGAPTN